MARRAPTPCREPGCSALVSIPGHCPQHTPGDLSKGARGPVETQGSPEGRPGTCRNGSRLPIYGSTRWRKLSKLFRSRNPLCAHCQAVGETTPAVLVDHIKEIKDRPELQWDWNNLQSLCRACHDRKTSIEALNRKRRENP